MKILYLTNNYKFCLFEELKKYNHQTVFYDQRIDVDYLSKEKIEFIVSYNYKYIIDIGVVSQLKNRIVNLHISYLPFNRGAFPNVFSFLDDTPKGVSIHYIDEGVDTGDILVQKKVFMDEKAETFETSYVKLNREIKNLFMDNWTEIIKNNLVPRKQIKDAGTFHRKKDFEPLLNYFGDSFWRLKISEIKKIIKEEGLYEKQ